MSAPLPPFTTHFAALAPAYDVVLCDVWGVVHNGVAATAEACDALARFRQQGGTVVLITNAPRPGEVVARGTLDRLKVPRAAYDGIVSSGDVTRAADRGARGRARLPYRPGARSADLRGARCPRRAGRERRLRGLLGPLRRHGRDAAGLPRSHRRHARARPHHGLRQSRHRGRARRSSWSIARARSPISMPPPAAR